MVCIIVSIYFDSPQLRIQNKLYKTLDYWSRDMLNFNFWEKGLGKVSPPYFTFDFARKMFLMLYSINWPNLIVWFPLLFEILGNIGTAIVCLPVCDVINFEIILIFLIKQFFYMNKKSRQTANCTFNPDMSLC